ncbi:hypothetical protein Agub_g388, partial [Astrephomene gubernaculifera]
MADTVQQSEYIIVPCDYEALLRKGYEREHLSLKLSLGHEIALLQKQHAEELLKRDTELEGAREEGTKLKNEILAWRKKAVMYKIKWAGAVDGLQLSQAQLTSTERTARKIAEEREVLLRGCKELQDQVQVLTALCQGQHRAKVQQQGQLESTGAEAKQLHSQLAQSQEFAELLARQLASERAALEAARHDGDALREELAQRTSELQLQVSECAKLRAQCGQLEATLNAEQEARAAVEARVSKLGSDLALREKEREAAEHRLLRHMESTAKRDEMFAQEAQRIRAADEAVIQELRYSIDHLKALLDKCRQEAELESRRQLASLQREASLREKLEADCARYRDKLQEEQDNYSTAVAQLRRQVGERGVESQLLQEKLEAAERRISAHTARVVELEAAMERSTRHLGQQVTSRDAEMAALQEQLDQHRRKLEHKEAELRDAQAAHARQMELMQRRLAEQEAAARDQEAQLRRQIDSARQEAQLADSTGSRAQHRLTELQDMLAAREERLRQLQAELAAEHVRRDAHMRQLQEGHAAQVAGLEARIRQLEQQLVVMPSPMEPQRYQVRSAAAAVDKLMGNLLGSAQSFSTGGMGSIDEEYERGPTADLILRLSQQPLPQIMPATQPVQQAGATVDASQRDAPPAAAADGSGAGTSNAAAAPVEPAKAGTGKRGLEQPPDAEERPAGKGRGRKAAKSKEEQRAAATKAAASQDDADEEPPAELPSQDPAPSGRAATRRRAAQSGLERAKAMAAALANDSGNDTETVDTPGFELRSSRAQRNASRAAQKQAQAAKAAQKAQADTEDPPSDAEAGGSAEPTQAAAAAAAAPPPAAKTRTRGGRGAKGSKAQDSKAEQSDAGPSGSQPPAAAAPAPSAPENEPSAQAMPPPRQRAAAKKGSAAVAVAEAPAEGGCGSGAAGADDVDVVPATQEADLQATQQPNTQQVPQPPTQPQPPPGRPLQQGANAGSGGAAAASYMPASSQVSIFSQTFKQYEPLLAKNPLAMLNPKLIEQAKNRMRLIPFTTLQQNKPVVPPSLAKGQGGGQQVGVKRPLSQ